MEPDGDSKIIANGILGDMCCEMWGQALSDEWNKDKEFAGESASKNGRWVDAAGSSS